MSKIALNMAVKNLSLELAPRKMICGLLHPGMVKTGKSRHASFLGDLFSYCFFFYL